MALKKWFLQLATRVNLRNRIFQWSEKEKIMLLRAFGVRVVVRLKEHNVSQLPVVDGIVPVVSPNTNLETLMVLFKIGD